MTTPIEIKSVKRVVVSAVGDAATFEANCASISGHAASLELAIMGALAYAFYTFHNSDGDARFIGVNRMRGITGLHAGLAFKLNQALTAITRAKVPDGKTVRETALAFANETSASIFHFETKRKADAKAKAQDARLKKLADTKKAADAALKAAKEEGKKEAEAEATIDVFEHSLVGINGHVECLTPEEYMELAHYLCQIRSNANKPEEVQHTHNNRAQRKANVADKAA